LEQIHGVATAPDSLVLNRHRNLEKSGSISFIEQK
jgi:hypothetical protein